MPFYMETCMKRFICFHHLDLAAKGRFVDLQNLFMGLSRLVDNGLQSCPLQLWNKVSFSPSQITLSSLELREVSLSSFLYMLTIYSLQAMMWML